MTHTIVVDVPEQVYQPLEIMAKNAGITTQELALRCLTAYSGEGLADPLEPFIGAIQSSVPDLAEHHDRYLGLKLAEDLGS